MLTDSGLIILVGQNIVVFPQCFLVYELINDGEFVVGYSGDSFCFPFFVGNDVVGSLGSPVLHEDGALSSSLSSGIEDLSSV